jgi:hypothetical protein
MAHFAAARDHSQDLYNGLNGFPKALASPTRTNSNLFNPFNPLLFPSSCHLVAAAGRVEE